MSMTQSVFSGSGLVHLGAFNRRCPSEGEDPTEEPSMDDILHGQRGFRLEGLQEKAAPQTHAPPYPAIQSRKPSLCSKRRSDAIAETINQYAKNRKIRASLTKQGFFEPAMSMSNPKLVRYDRFGCLRPYLLREPQCGQFYRCAP